MFDDVLNDIQDSIGRLHNEIEAKRKQLDDAPQADQSPQEGGEEQANMQDEIKRLLDKCYRAIRW
jgi:hypothetical protein